MGCVYSHTNKINGKKYIGLTIYDIDKRLNEHIYNSKTGKYHFHKALRKYGVECFISEILFESDNINELREKEIHFINYYNTFEDGYNSTKGGEGFFSKHKDESKKKMSEYRKTLIGDKNTFYGKKHKCKTKNIMSEKKKKLSSDGFYQSDKFLNNLSYRKYKYIATFPDGKVIETINHKDIQKYGVPFVHNVAKSKTNFCKKTGIKIVRVKL